MGTRRNPVHTCSCRRSMSDHHLDFSPCYLLIGTFQALPELILTRLQRKVERSLGTTISEKTNAINNPSLAMYAHLGQLQLRQEFLIPTSRNCKYRLAEQLQLFQNYLANACLGETFRRRVCKISRAHNHIKF